MKSGSLLTGLLRHARVTLQLNFRSPQALVYGYLVPVFFLLAFGSVFRGDTPVLLGQMGQLLTITVLGGACFGLPTGLVAERERGVWRRYRLLPAPTGSLVASTLAVRVLLIGTAVVLQVALARLIYGTPLPVHPGQSCVALVFVLFAFLGLGLLVAALANDVPAVQALGQCLFLPMIMIGGVGVPLAALPVWAQRLAGFMPGRYAVDVLQRSYHDPAGLHGAGFSLLALVVVGAAAGLAGTRLFRWDAGRRSLRSAGIWIGLALLGWIAVGATAAATGRLHIVVSDAAGYAAITDRQMDLISYADLPGDDELVTRLAPPFEPGQADGFVADFTARLKAWPPDRETEIVQLTRNLLSVAAVADLSPDLHEAEIGRIVFDELQSRIDQDRLRRVLTWIILRPAGGKVVSQIPELGMRRHPPDALVRERSALYAKKYLGRLLGKIRD